MMRIFENSHHVMIEENVPLVSGRLGSARQYVFDSTNGVPMYSFETA